MGLLENNLKKKEEEAESYLIDINKRDRFLLKLENKLKVVPKVGDKLAKVPLFASLLYDYLKGDYKEIPVGSILSVIACLLYFVSTIDFIPDVIPFLGYLDDAVCLGICSQWISQDIADYEAWRRWQATQIS